MFKSDWLKFVPGDSLEESINFLNSLYWNITWRHDGDRWIAFAGERLLVATATKRELEAFILGMTIGLAVLPDSLLNEIKKWCEE